ncbi:phage scaffolding protein [Cytobacillus firmus]|uniref:phage scaffolding protein n=1 Tax=Cytobacillus firmus TaxID=1399 RepID=UPI0018CC9411|nr:phage scaffolding protein [Cytobacillus firmus]MBG9548341.1 hypothetical protein [Cytobacillus firmus]MBG9600809.1 hypothetical protein [Cytobacillus firmus]MBG9657827.1 hypothetical protein [Cytobacillus firmus]MED1904830.1 phage scaffolding protein [Cytobacillus firmus]MED1938934.1 phage scaffolding protein [Cytobacillus firmus]
MNREFLKNLGIEETLIDSIMAEHGKTVQSLQAKNTDLTTNLDDLKKQMDQRDKDLKELKKQAEGSEELQKKLDDLQKQYDTEKAAYAQKLKDMQLTSALKLTLAADVHDTDLVATLLDKSKIELDENGNIKAGLKEQLEALRESKAFLFVPKQEGSDQKFKGFSPADGKPAGAGGTKNPFSKEHFNLTEQARLFKENPELYKQLKAQAE